MNRAWVVLLALLLGGLPGSAAGAQQKVRVESSGVEPGTIKLGDSAWIVLTVKGTQEVRLEALPKVEGLRFESGGPSERTFISSDGFRQFREVSVSFRIRVTPTRTGRFEIPPLRILVDRQPYATEVDRLEVVEDFLGRQFGWFEVEASQSALWMHQPVTVTALIGLDESQVRADRIQGLSVRLPWWEKVPGALLLEEPEVPGDSLELLVNDRRARARRLGVQTRQGRSLYMLALVRTFLPTEEGEIRLGAGFITFKMVTRFGTDFFGQRVAAETETCTLPGREIRLPVKPLPEAGRPAGFSGAVGAFRLEAAAAPAEVRVGDSVKLTLAIRGEGNLGFFSVPDLRGLEGFRVYGKTEDRQPGVLQVTYDLAPLREELEAIPPIAFSFFDTTPGSHGYRTETTRAIPLAVRPLPEGAGLGALPDARPRVTPGVDDIYDLKPFDPSVPLPRPDRVDGMVLGLGLGVPPLVWAAVLVALGLRRRALADPAALRRRRALARFLREKQPDPAALGCAFEAFLGDLLGLPAAAVQGGGWRARARERGVGEELAGRLDTLQEELDRARFAPSGGRDTAALRTLAVELARALDRAAGKGGR